MGQDEIFKIMRERNIILQKDLEKLLGLSYNNRNLGVTLRKMKKYNEVLIFKNPFNLNENIIILPKELRKE